MLVLIDGDVLIYRNIWKKESLEEAIESLELDITDIVESNFATDYQLALGSSEDNFRSDLYSEYKKSASRSSSRSNRSELYQPVKDYLIARNNVTFCEGFEADDMLRIWWTEAQANKEVSIICSIDKDLNCIPGLHYDIRNRTTYLVTEEDADRFYWIQLLTGDTVDNIPGLPGIGPVKAKLILEGCLTHEQCKVQVVNSYKEYYKDAWWEYLTVNGRLLHIWRKFNDHFHIPRDF
jgi:5'-3' exonuclease